MPRPTPFSNTPLTDTELNARTVDVIGDLDLLQTVNKTTLVDAINSASFYTPKAADGFQRDIYLSSGAELRDFFSKIPKGGFGHARIDSSIVIDQNSIPVLTDGRGAIVNLENNAQIVFQAYVDSTTGYKRLPTINITSNSYLHFSVSANPITEPMLAVDLSLVSSSTASWDPWTGRRNLFLTVHSQFRWDMSSSDTVDQRLLADLSGDPNLLLAQVSRGNFLFSTVYNGGTNRGIVKVADTTTPQEIVRIDTYADFMFSFHIADSAGNIVASAPSYPAGYVQGLAVQDASTEPTVVRNVICPYKIV